MINNRKLGFYGMEYTRSDGIVEVFIGKNKRVFKQRLLYELYHNVKLKNNEFIIFLDQNKNNFDIKNLVKINSSEKTIMSCNNLFSKDKEITKTGLHIAKLKGKIKSFKE